MNDMAVKYFKQLVIILSTCSIVPNSVSSISLPCHYIVGHCRNMMSKPILSLYWSFSQNFISHQIPVVDKFFWNHNNVKNRFWYFRGNFRGEGVEEKIVHNLQMNPSCISNFWVTLIFSCVKRKKKYMHLRAYVHLHAYMCHSAPSISFITSKYSIP